MDFRDLLEIEVATHERSPLRDGMFGIHGNADSGTRQMGVFIVR